MTDKELFRLIGADEMTTYEPDHKPTISKREVVAWAALAANLAAVVALAYWWVAV